MIKKLILQVLQDNEEQLSLSDGEQTDAIDSQFFDIVAEEIEEKILGDLKNASLPLIKFLCTNYHPHITAIVTPTSIEVLEGKESIPKILDFVVD